MRATIVRMKQLEYALGLVKDKLNRENHVSLSIG